MKINERESVCVCARSACLAFKLMRQWSSITIICSIGWYGIDSLGRFLRCCAYQFQFDDERDEILRNRHPNGIDINNKQHQYLDMLVNVEHANNNDRMRFCVCERARKLF